MPYILPPATIKYTTSYVCSNIKRCCATPPSCCYHHHHHHHHRHRRLLMGNAAAGSGFPYHIEEVDPTYDNRVFQLREGKRKEDGEKVSIFTVEKKDCSPALLAAAQNFHRRLKTIRHPHILRYIDGVELETSIHVVTEHVRPFEHPRRRSPEDIEAVALGLFQVTSAIAFLNTDHKMVHANICPSSLFITDAGEWKLGGFHLLHPHGRITEIVRDSYTILPERYRSPEVKEKRWGTLQTMPVWTMDAWSLGCLIYDIFHDNFNSTEQLTQCSNIPKPLLPVYKRLLSSTSRLNPKKVLPNKFFKNFLVKSICFLDNLALKTDQEKATFFQHFSGKVTTLPPALVRHRILPQLLQALSYGAGMGSAFAAILTVVIKLGETLSDQEYEKLVVPAVVKLFACNERQVRVHLLRHLHEYASHIPPGVVEKNILPHVATGFTDANAVLRELTLKSLIHLAPKLSNAVMDTTVLKHLTKMQADSEPGIRTNTIYCIAKVCSTFGEANRRKILFRGFLKGLRDPFGPARLASLASLQACVSHFTADDIAKRILPSATPLAVDASEPVRNACIKMLGVMCKSLQKASVERAKALAESKENSAGPGKIKSIGGNGYGAASSSSSSSSAGGAANRYGGAVLSTMSSWASAGITAVATYAAKTSSSDTSSTTTTATKNSTARNATNAAASSSVHSTAVASNRGATKKVTNSGRGDAGRSAAAVGASKAEKSGWDDGDLDLDLFDDGNDDEKDGGIPIEALSLGGKKKKNTVKKSKRRNQGRQTKKQITNDNPWGMNADSGGGNGAMDLSKMINNDITGDRGGDSLDDMLSSLNTSQQNEKKAQPTGGGWGESGTGNLDDLLGNNSNDAGGIGESVLLGNETGAAQGETGGGGGGDEDWNSFMQEALDS